jgi:hypothetical protein
MCLHLILLANDITALDVLASDLAAIYVLTSDIAALYVLAPEMFAPNEPTPDDLTTNGTAQEVLGWTPPMSELEGQDPIDKTEVSHNHCAGPLPSRYPREVGNKNPREGGCKRPRPLDPIKGRTVNTDTPQKCLVDPMLTSKGRTH